MKEVWIITKEQFRNFGIIFRMSKYEEKATYQNHYLGLLWQILNPMTQMGNLLHNFWLRCKWWSEN